jgi:hypothetical protein
MHSGRHFYASVQLAAGTSSVPWLSTWAGPGFALRTYHLMPQSQDKAKRAVGALFERLDEVADDPLRGPAAQMS